MLVEFRDARGKTRFRTLTRTNVRKVAESINTAHPSHGLPQTVAMLRNLLDSGRDTAALTCICETRK